MQWRLKMPVNTTSLSAPVGTLIMLSSISDVFAGTLSSPSGFIPPPRPDELYYYGEDHDTEFDDFDDPESD